MKRIERLRELVRDLGLAGCLVSKPENIYYFTGVYPIESSFLVVSRDGDAALIVAPSSYPEAREKADDQVEVALGGLNMTRSLRRCLLDMGCLPRQRGVLLRDALTRALLPPLGIEGDSLGIGIARNLGLGKSVDISPYVMEMRMVKDGAERRAVERACEVADEAMERALDRIKPGMRETEVSGIFDREAKRLGGNDTKARVRSGRNSAKPFARLMDGVIKEGPLMIDYGATYENYWSDITRTFHVGRPGEDFRDAYEAVLEARQQGLRHLRARGEISVVDRVVREVLMEHGYGDCIVYTSGHGVGLEVHEPPIVSVNSPKPEIPRFHGRSDAERLYQSMISFFYRDEEPVFHRNTVIAYEPGVYLPEFGARIEDMVLIGGKPHVLSRLPTDIDGIQI
jgi:Xaa-Pro aminopeptidase